MLDQPEVAYAVIVLGVNATYDAVEEIQKAAEVQGMHFGSAWDRYTLVGFYYFPNELAALTRIAEQAASRFSDQRRYHYRLATWWLSTALLTAEEWTLHQLVSKCDAPTEPPTEEAPSPTDTPAAPESAITSSDTNESRSLYDWSKFFQQTPDDYRETLVDIALRHVNRVSIEPYLTAAQYFKDLELKGFRAGKVPHQVMRQHCLRLANDSPAVARYLINLWADASHITLSEFRSAAEARGFRLEEDWPGGMFITGYYNDEPVQPLVALAHELGTDLPRLKRDQVFLAAYWFSAALLVDEDSSAVAAAPAPVQDETTPPHESVTSPVSTGLTPAVETSAPPAPADAPLGIPESPARISGRYNLANVRAFAQATITANDDLPTIRQALAADLRSLDKMRQGILPDLQALHNAVDTSNLPYAEERFEALYQRLITWRLAFEILFKDGAIFAERSRDELARRPGLSEQPSTVEDVVSTGPHYAQIKALASQFIGIIDEMLDYDVARETAWKELLQRRAQ